MSAPSSVPRKKWITRCCECVSLFCGAVTVLPRLQRNFPIRPDYDYAIKPLTPVPCAGACFRRVHPPDKSEFLVVTFGGVDDSAQKAA